MAVTGHSPHILLIGPVPRFLSGSGGRRAGSLYLALRGRRAVS